MGAVAGVVVDMEAVVSRVVAEGMVVSQPPVVDLWLGARGQLATGSLQGVTTDCWEMTREVSTRRVNVHR